ncbi:MAG: helix-hairpin-helix domain-containing protein [Bacteroidales bacterium]|nr:helix-hairpin-helix domain-containing protein [Bacteroidales bacterium]
MTKFRAYCILAFLAFVAVVVLLLLRRPTAPVNVFPVNDSVEIVSNSQKKQAKSNRKSYGSNSDSPRSVAKFEQPSRDSLPVKPATRKALMVELNSADTLTLQMLYGIGPAFAKRIVRYRERLGGFVSTEQLLEVYGLTEDRYRKLLPHIMVDQEAVSKIKINEVTLKQLVRHPYMEYYQARDLISLRDKGQRYHSTQDLLLAPTMDTVSLQRIAPYIDFSE